MALLLVMGVLAAHGLRSLEEGSGSQGILGGPTLVTDPVEPAEEASLVGIPQALASAELLPREEVATSLSTASLSASGRIASGAMIQAAMAVATVEGGADAKKEAEGLPRLVRYFIQPASGVNWGILHAHNAVDIANVCGTSVVASAEGVVVDSNQGGWNGGYGSYLTIEHPNGTRTKYAHMEKVLSATGDEVRQGEQVGTIGNTGFVHGVTGCHLHFEVYGAVNPFAKK